MKKFKNIYVEIIKNCNLKCPFCPSSKLKQKQKISYDQFKLIIEQIKDYTEGIYLHILGEPLLHPDLFKMIEYASMFVKVSLTTNGHLLGKYLNQIINSNLYILNLSMQSLVNKSDAFIEEYFKNVLLLLENKKNTLNVHLRIWNNHKNNYLLNQKLHQLIEKNHLTSYTNVHISYGEEFDWPSINDEENLNHTKCLGGKKQLGILTNGDVVCCCLDYLGNTKIGNIYETLFSQIINDKQYLKVLDGWNKQQPYFELCKKCTYRNRFMKGNKQ